MKNRSPLPKALVARLQSVGIENPEKSVAPFCLLAPPRQMAILDALEETTGVEGETAEIGCASGGTSLIISSGNGGRRHWAIDTFEGLVDNQAFESDLWAGQFGSKEVTHQAVSIRLAVNPLACCLKGYFPQCAPPEMLRAKYSFVHLDVDTYSSIHAGWEFFAKRMNVGGMIALDDVIGRGTIGAKKAWREIDKSRFVIVSQNDPQVIVRFEG